MYHRDALRAPWSPSLSTLAQAAAGDIVPFNFNYPNPAAGPVNGG